LPVVVAVDGSPESQHALGWAAGVARSDGRGLCVVTAFRSPPVVTDDLGTYWDHHQLTESAARVAAEAAIEAVFGPGAAVEHRVVHGSIEDVLRACAHEASLLVIGTRRTKAWHHRLRGSVTNRVTGSVSCPVVSVPLGDDLAA
jgi:nucleotide-binding universal stress UspA family protein